MRSTIRNTYEEPTGSFFYSRGFTMPELVAVIVIASILGAVALPRLWGSTFDESRLYDETVAALRYAHRTALSYQLNVCVNFSGGNQLSLTYASTYGTDQACGPALTSPAGSGSAYQVTARGSTSYVSATNFAFDRLGRPYISPFGSNGTSSQAIQLSDGRVIHVEAETGYVH